MGDSGGTQEVIDLDSDDSGEEDFDTFETGASYTKVRKTHFFSRLNNTVNDEEGENIWVKTINLMIDENKVNHFTSEYDNKRLIIRRGQTFKIKITLNKTYDESRHSIALLFFTGDKPSPDKGTLLDAKRTETLSNDSWGYKIEDQADNVLTLNIVSSARSVIGYYKLLIECTTTIDLTPSLTSTTCIEEIFLLFNCWCKEDTVYLESEEEREEYVLNDTGLIWAGTFKDFEPIAWNFGQFEICILECAMFLLSNANLAVSARGDPVKLVRAMSAQINSNDEGGVLWGRWTETYPKDATDPCDWVGSVEILRQYLLNEEPVRYGQCWVFSGVLTTVLRCLGIPTRSVTNFESGHDTDCSHTIDCHYDLEGNPVDDLDDSVWNFHVWNECWMKRLDIPPGYDGWQAVDSTPQEASENIMRCGPCPLSAIKEGDIYLPYDCGFLFAEVNGDKVYWKVEASGDMSVEWIDRHCIGKKISTKGVGTDERVDITDLYKHPEGSRDEERVTDKASQFGSRQQYNIKNVPQEVKVEILPATALLGQQIVIPVKIENTSKKNSRSVTTTIHVKSVSYTGRSDNKNTLVKSENSFTELSKEECHTIEVKIDPKQYSKKLKAGSVLKIFLQMQVQESKQVYACQESCLVKKSTAVSVTIDKTTVKQYEEFTVTCSYNNTSNEKLCNTYFYLEGPGIRRSKRLYCGTVQDNSTIERKIVLSAYRAGDRVLFVKFCSDKVSNAVDKAHITVEKIDATDVL